MSAAGTQPRGRRWPLSIAPMMEWTDRNYRYFMRRITRCTLLYTEMITAEAVLRGDRARLLDFHADEHPLALQLGGDDPARMAEAARIGEDFGYDEINVNVGCPSDRVRRGSFGACLMAEPGRVADIVSSMRARVRVPVTVKQRIGIDGRETYAELAEFVRVVASAGCDRFAVHARIAVLGGLSPAENRSIPPLRYEDVFRLKRDFPGCHIELNGGVRSLDEAHGHLQHVDGVMVGRAAYENPYLFANADRDFFLGEPGFAEAPDREAIVHAMIPYLEQKHRQGYKLTHVVRHMLALFHGQPGGRRWRRHLSENAYRPERDASLLLEALELVRDAAPGLPVA